MAWPALQEEISEPDGNSNLDYELLKNPEKNKNIFFLVEGNFGIIVSSFGVLKRIVVECCSAVVPQVERRAPSTRSVDRI